MRTVASLATLVGLAVLTTTGAALAQPYQGYLPANSLPWPLWRQDDPTKPREALGNSFGEFQDFGVFYLHSGIDIRGAEGDIVKIAAPGNIWVTVNYNDDFCDDVASCRIYVKGDDAKYVYYYSHLALHGGDSEITAETREKITNASRWDQPLGSYPVQPNTHVDTGEILSRIGPFHHVGWPHMHFAIIDASDGWDPINPLTALIRTQGGIDIVDDEPPQISALELFGHGTETPVSIPTACSPISGNLDVAATVQDSFYTTNPVPAPVEGGYLSSFGIYQAGYLIRDVSANTVVKQGTWYRFDRATLECAGGARGIACPTHGTEAMFFDHSFHQSSAGIEIGEPYTPFLFATTRSTSDYLGDETHVLLLTNEWGIPGSWNTPNFADGWYQISATARDADGNEHARSRFVAIDNHGGFVGPADAYVRDNSDDVGALPSTLGGKPFWESPDIFIMPQGLEPGVNPPQTLLEANVTYDVYLRVHNDSCQTVNGVKAQIYSANPSMIVDTSQWSWVTTAGQWLPASGVTLAPGETKFVGPFQWTPDAVVATTNQGHRCMLAKIDASNDPIGSAGVPDNNNIAQRNVQFGNTSFRIENPDSQSARIDTEMRCSGVPMSTSGTVLELKTAYDSTLYEAWKNASGATVTISGSNMLVHFTKCNVRLPTVTLQPNAKIPASFKSVVGAGGGGPYLVNLRSSKNGVLQGGMSFVAAQ
jgi:hypothetical protein